MAVQLVHTYLNSADVTRRPRSCSATVLPRRA
jgi:hypothetical protein